MCGRISLYYDKAKLIRVLELREARMNDGFIDCTVRPRGELLAFSQKHILARARWGVNEHLFARGETLSRLPTWQDGLPVAIPATSFMERGIWFKADTEPILPSPLFCIGGLYLQQGLVIVTTEAQPEVALVHHRQPLVMYPDQVGTWLQQRTIPESPHFCRLFGG